jgi:iron(III) transport system substrate-binding protein
MIFCAQRQIRYRPGLISLLLLCYALDSLPAVAQDSDLLANAKKEKTVNLYTSMETRESRLIADAFQQRYPSLTVDIARVSSNRLLQKIDTEHRAGRNLFDVVITSGLEVRYLIKSGLISQYVSPEAKAFFSDSKDPQGRWVDVYSSLRVFAHNTKLVSRDVTPKQYEDLLSPRWKGQIGLPSKEYSWFATAMRALGKNGGKQFMEGLGKQKPNYRPSHVLVLQLIAAGEFNLGLVYQHQLERYKKLAAPVELTPLPLRRKIFIQSLSRRSRLMPTPPSCLSTLSSPRKHRQWCEVSAALYRAPI